MPFVCSPKAISCLPRLSAMTQRFRWISRLQQPSQSHDFSLRSFLIFGILLRLRPLNPSIFTVLPHHPMMYFSPPPIAQSSLYCDLTPRHYQSRQAFRLPFSSFSLQSLRQSWQHPAYPASAERRTRSLPCGSSTPFSLHFQHQTLAGY